MKFSEFCDMTENTEQEQPFLQFVRETHKDVIDAMEEENAAAAIKRVPFVGKWCAAVAALSNAESLAEFRQSEHYPFVMDWDVTFDPDTNKFSLSGVSAEQRKKAAMVFGIVVAVIAALLIFCKIRRRKKAA